MSTLSSFLKWGRQTTMEAHRGGGGLPASMRAQLEGMGFEHLGEGFHRTAFGHGDRVLKVARNPIQNISEAASSVRYPKTHPHMARVLGTSDTGYLSAMERAFGAAGEKPGRRGMRSLSRRFLDLHPGNLMGGKAIDYGVPKVRYPLEQERQLAQTLGGTQGMRDVFADVPGFSSWMDEFEGGAAQLPAPNADTVKMGAQRAARPREVRRAARRHGLPRLAAPHSASAPDLPVGRAFSTRFRRRGTYSLPS